MLQLRNFGCRIANSIDVEALNKFSWQIGAKQAAEKAGDPGKTANKRLSGAKALLD
jgi:hypothetical protein